MKRQILFPILAAAVALTAVSNAAFAVDACKGVTFTVKNDHVEGRKIQIRKVKFRNAHNQGKQQTEVVKNVVCAFGSTCKTGGDNLKNANQVNLYDFQVYFKYWERDEEWSDEFHTVAFEPAIRKCWKDRNYGPITVSDRGNP